MLDRLLVDSNKRQTRKMEILEAQEQKKNEEFIPEPGPREGFTTNRQFQTINSGLTSGRGLNTNRSIKGTSPRKKVSAKSPRRRKYDHPKYSDPILDISAGGNVQRYDEKIGQDDQILKYLEDSLDKFQNKAQ